MFPLDDESLEPNFLGSITIDDKRSLMLRVALYYGGEVHQSVKNFSPRLGYLRRAMVWRRR